MSSLSLRMGGRPGGGPGGFLVITIRGICSTELEIKKKFQVIKSFNDSLDEFTPFVLIYFVVHRNPMLNLEVHLLQNHLVILALGFHQE